MDQYILDENNQPQLVESSTRYYAWKNAQPEAMQTGIGLQVAKTKISETIFVSTVYLGSDHGYGGGAPVLWETIVFVEGGDYEMERYSSHAEAVAGHERWCEAYRAKQKASRIEEPGDEAINFKER